MTIENIKAVKATAFKTRDLSGFFIFSPKSVQILLHGPAKLFKRRDRRGLRRWISSLRCEYGTLWFDRHDFVPKLFRRAALF